jgi:uncharacterized protein YukE
MGGSYAGGSYANVGEMQSTSTKTLDNVSDLFSQIQTLKTYYDEFRKYCSGPWASTLDGKFDNLTNTITTFSNNLGNVSSAVNTAAGIYADADQEMAAVANREGSNWG